MTTKPLVLKQLRILTLAIVTLLAGGMVRAQSTDPARPTAISGGEMSGSVSGSGTYYYVLNVRRNERVQVDLHLTFKAGIGFSLDFQGPNGAVLGSDQDTTYFPVDNGGSGTETRTGSFTAASAQRVIMTLNFSGNADYRVSFKRSGGTDDPQLVPVMPPVTTAPINPGETTVVPTAPAATTAPPRRTKADMLPACDLRVFERPNYQGRNGRFTPVGGRLAAPFPVSNASFIIPAGKMVYIRTFTEFSSELVFTESQPTINLENITGIRCDDKVTLSVALSGIATTVHNNDCKKVFGTITIKVTEASPDSARVRSTMRLSSRPGSPATTAENSDIFTAFRFRNANAIPAAYYQRNIYTHDYGLRRTLARQEHNASEAYFIVGKKAMLERRVNVSVTADLGSAHKTCDLCDDFSSHIKMAAPVSQDPDIFLFYDDAGRARISSRANRVASIGLTSTLFEFGPYLASGSRDGAAVTATAGTVKEFKFYLKMAYVE